MGWLYKRENGYIDDVEKRYMEGKGRPLDFSS